MDSAASLAYNHPELIDGDITIIVACIVGAFFVFLCKKLIDIALTKITNRRFFIASIISISTIAFIGWFAILIYLLEHRIIIN